MDGRKYISIPKIQLLHREVWKGIINFILLFIMDGITYPLKLIDVSKMWNLWLSFGGPSSKLLWKWLGAEQTSYCRNQRRINMRVGQATSIVINLCLVVRYRLEKWSSGLRKLIQNRWQPKNNRVTVLLLQKCDMWWLSIDLCLCITRQIDNPLLGSHMQIRVYIIYHIETHKIPHIPHLLEWAILYLL